MPFENIEQPQIIDIDADLRIKRYNKENWKIALPWYNDMEVVLPCDGAAKGYDLERLYRMYNYLNNIGELYFIEVLKENSWCPIGDVTLSQKNTAIVIGLKEYWGKAIGKRVMRKLIERAGYIKLKGIKVSIFNFNKRSMNLFEGLGFVKISEDAKSSFYELTKF